MESSASHLELAQSPIRAGVRPSVTPTRGVQSTQMWGKNGYYTRKVIVVLGIYHFFWNLDPRGKGAHSRRRKVGMWQFSKRKAKEEGEHKEDCLGLSGPIGSVVGSFWGAVLGHNIHKSLKSCQYRSPILVLHNLHYLA